MNIIRTAIAFLLSAAVTYVLASVFYTQQVIAKMAEVGAVYSTSQQVDTYVSNFTGLYQLGIMYAIALFAGFAVAFIVKRILKPLAPVAYPIAGGAGVFAVLWAIDTFIAGGNVGAIGGARDALGLSLQVLAGAIGGGVFAFMRPR